MLIFHRARWLGLLVKIASTQTNFVLITDKSAFHLKIGGIYRSKFFFLAISLGLLKRDFLIAGNIN